MNVRKVEDAKHLEKKMENKNDAWTRKESGLIKIKVAEKKVTRRHPNLA